MPYPKKTLGDLTTFVASGITPRGGNATYVESGPQLIRSQNVLMGSLSMDNVARINPEIFDSMRRVRVLFDDVNFEHHGSVNRKSLPGRNRLGRGRRESACGNHQERKYRESGPWIGGGLISLVHFLKILREHGVAWQPGNGGHQFPPCRATGPARWREFSDRLVVLREKEMLALVLHSCEVVTPDGVPRRSC